MLQIKDLGQPNRIMVILGEKKLLKATIPFQADAFLLLQFVQKLYIQNTKCQMENVEIYIL